MTSASGQTEKVSQRAFLDRCTPESGRGFDRGERQLRAKTGREQAQQRVGGRLLDDLVGAREERVQDGEPERLGSLQVDDQFVFRRRLHREVGRLLALEDAVDIPGCSAELIDQIGRKGHQAAVGYEYRLLVNCGQFVSCNHFEPKVTMSYRQRARLRERFAEVALFGFMR